MEGLIKDITELNGTVELNGLDITIIVPNKFSQQQLFEFGMYIEGFNNSNSKLYFPVGDALVHDDRIIVKGRIN